MNKGCLISSAIAFVVFSLALGYYFVKKSTKAPVVYEVNEPFMTDIIKKTVATGSIKPRQEVNIKPQVSGIVDKLYVEAGNMVTKGQKIAKIKLIPSPVNINNAESNVELARIRYNEAKRELSRQKEVNTKNLDVETARVNYENAKTEEARQKQLFDDGIISEQDYNGFKLELDVAKTAFENAQITSTSSLKQFESEVDIREQELEAAINNLQLLREGASKKSKQVSNIVVSTVDGMVLDIPVEEGSSVIERNNFNEGTSIATVADMNSLIFEGKVDESDVGKLEEGMNLELTVGAIDEEKFGAVLEYISPKGVEEEGTVKFVVKAAIKPTSETFLRAGYSASGDIILDKREQVLAVKERDIVFKNDSAFVDVEIGEQKFRPQHVEIGLSDGINIEITQGLDTTNKVKVMKGSVN
ncbi:MAG: HlyD family efflux transporter periplasmic adaptor subunit [Bacteroidota bacterium]